MIDLAEIERLESFARFAAAIDKAEFLNPELLSKLADAIATLRKRIAEQQAELTIANEVIRRQDKEIAELRASLAKARDQLATHLANE